MQPLPRHRNDVTQESTTERRAARNWPGPKVRRCVATGQTLGTDELIRFVVSTEGRLVYDADERLPGPGYWVCADRATIERAIAARRFAKAARRSVTVPDDLLDQVQTRLRQRCLNTISLANRAGLSVMGREKTVRWLREGNIGVVLVAADGSQSELARTISLASSAVVVNDFLAVELGATVGRTHIVHAAIRTGKLANGLIRDVFRLRGVDSGSRKTDCQAALAGSKSQTELR